MRPLLILPALSLLAACADAPTATTAMPDADLRTRQAEACTAAIAAHIRRPATEIETRWLSEAGGIAQVQTLDGSRRHLCTVDAAARVLGYSHPDG